MSTWRDYVRTVTPYTPGEQPDRQKMIKLNTNENPYPPSPQVAKVFDGFDADTLRLYPDPAVKPLTCKLAEFYGIDEDQVFVGVGSDDVIAMIFMTFFNSDKPIVFPDISYSFYPVWSDVFRIPYEAKPLDNDFRIVKEDYYGENGGVIFPNPNAPTSIYESLDFVEDILKHNKDVLVVVDEAYIDFGGKSAIELINRYDNLLVVQTFSKSRACAGVRLGYAMGNKELIKALSDVKYSFNSYTINRLAIAAGVAAVEDKAYFEKCCNKIVATREWTKKELLRLGFSFPEPMGNFIFASHKSLPAKELFEALRANEIFVRYFPMPRIDNYLRISIGTDDQMKEFIAFVENYIKTN